MKSRNTVLSLAVALIPLVTSVGIQAAAPPAETSTPATKPAAKPDADAKANPRCQHLSGSRIRPTTATGCPNGGQMIRSYTKDQIQTTGEIDMAEALKKLDPIFY